MKNQIEKEFRNWVKQFTEEKVVISIDMIDGDWFVDMYNETGKDFFQYKSNGNFEWMGAK